MFWFSKKTKEVQLGKCWAEDSLESRRGSIGCFLGPNSRDEQTFKVCCLNTLRVMMMVHCEQNNAQAFSSHFLKITANNTVCLHFYFVNHINVNQFKALVFRLWSCSRMLEMSFSPSVQAETGSVTFNIRWAKTHSCLSNTQRTSTDSFLSF